MSATLTDAIEETVEKVWRTLLGLVVTRQAASADAGGPSGWSGVIRISGAWDGEVRVLCSPELAHRAAAAMFAVERGAANASQAEDALREVTNVTGGNLMEILPGPSHLSMPTVSNGGGAPLAPGSLLLSRVHFDCHGEPLSVVVLRTLPES